LAITLIERTVSEITRPSSAWREAALDLPGEAHARLVAEAACLHEIEAGGPFTNTKRDIPAGAPGTNTNRDIPGEPSPTNTKCDIPGAARATNTKRDIPAGARGTNTKRDIPGADHATNTKCDIGAARIVAWNAERLKFLDASAERLKALAPDIILLTEVDLGMARSGNRHTIRELAERLGMAYVFGVEFVELGLGDERERAWHAGEANMAGLHGAGILANRPLERPRLLRLESDGHWFSGERKGERRIGGRIAMIAEAEVGGLPVTFVAVHHESHSDPRHRAEQTRLIRDAVADRPAVVIGGDFNTNSMSRAARAVPGSRAGQAARLLDPVAYEPLFDIMAQGGYDWRRCNRLGVATERTRPDGTPPPPLGRIDWFFSRGVASWNPEVVPAVDARGRAISDHEMLLVEVGPVEP